MEPNHNKSVTRKTEKNDKRRELVRCALPSCNVMYPQKGNKKYHSPKCQWTHWNEKHPIVREPFKK